MEARSLPKIVKCVLNAEAGSGERLQTTKYYILLDTSVSNSQVGSPETSDAIVNSILNLIPNFTIIQLTKPDYRAIYIGDNGFPVHKILRFNPLEKGSRCGPSENWMEVAPGEISTPVETATLNSSSLVNVSPKPEIVIKVAQEPKKPTIEIKKQTTELKKQTTEPKKGGWGSVLQELSQKIGGGLKSVEKKEETKAVGKLNTEKGGKIRFSSVIEELSFTLAKMKKPSEEKELEEI